MPPLHDFRWRMTHAIEHCHAFHGGSGMGEETLVGGTKVGEIGFARGGAEETVLGATTVAEAKKFAVSALTRQRIAFILTEFFLKIGLNQFDKRRLGDVAEAVVRIHVVVAGVEVAVVFEREGAAARFAEDADSTARVDPVAERDVEYLHKRTTDVSGDPFVKNRAQKIAVVAGFHAPFGGGQAFRRLPLGIRRRREVEAIALGGGVGQAFDKRDELDVTRTDVSQVAVNIERAARIVPPHDRERVELDAVLFHAPQRRPDTLERTASRFVHAVRIVDFGGAIEAQAHEEIVFGEEGAPFVVEQRAVGLEGILYELAARVAALQRDGLAKKIQPHQCRLAALPSKYDFRHVLRLDELTHVGFQHLVRHAKTLRPRKHFFLFEVKAVAAPQVAHGADGLAHDVEGFEHRLRF